ncbi:hypothetical protein ACIQNG_18475 [Streptomyces sp. NPDC091377]|uniref:hypothetical protein n=1 Tax=Streptomyces sp. NPDC091377 TaxID=3365995 RepID=UPI00380F57C6
MTDGNPPLLDYAIISDPFPLRAAADETTPLSTLQIVVSNGGTDTVYCSSIIISIPYGDLGQSLLSAKSGDASADGWTIQAVDKNSDAALPEGDYACFKATKPGGHDDGEVTSTGTAFIFRNCKISTKPGTARIVIREKTTTDVKHWPPNPRFATLPLTKYPRPDVPPEPVQDFHAVAADQQQLGQEVGAGQKIVLKWRGPKLEYKIICGPGAKETVKPDHETKGMNDGRFDFTWKGEVYRDTTFQLQYVIAETTHTQTTTVNVRDPRLTGLTVQGGTLIEAGKAKIEIRADKQEINLPQGEITSHGRIQSEGEISGASLKASGALEAKTVTANDTLTVKTGVAQVQALTVKGELVAEKSLTVDGILTAKSDIVAEKGVKATGDITTQGKVCGVTVTASNEIKRGDNPVLVKGDLIYLFNTTEKAYLYAANDHFDYDSDRGRVFYWKPGARVDNGKWRVD